MSDQRISRDFYIAFLILTIAVSIAFRAPFIFVERMWPDEALYAWNAQRIFEHPPMIFSKEVMGFHPPLFSVLLSLGHFFFPSWEACRHVVFLLNILGIIAVFVLGRTIGGNFLGCYSALVLSFNLQYFNMSNFILNDGAIAVFTIVVFLALARIDSQKIDSKDFKLGLAVMALLLLKWSAGLILPFLFLYYVAAFPEWPISRRIAKSAVPLSMAGLLITVLVWHNHNIMGSWIPQVFSAHNESYREPFLFYFRHLHPLVFPAPLLPFFAVGLAVIFAGRKHHDWAQGLWVIFGLLALSAMPTKDFRFLLAVIPSMVVVSGIGLESFLSLSDRHTFLKRVLRPAALLIVLCYLVSIHFNDIQENVLRKAYTFTGYQEAGTYIREVSQSNPSEIILASSPRMIRYFSKINFKEFGGKLQAFPNTREEFVRLVKNTNADMILAVDRWEMAQPGWVFPPTQENNQLLKDLGFKLQTKIVRDIQVSPRSLEKAAVIWIFRRPGQS